MRIKIFTLLFLALGAGNVFAQPANNDCFNGEMIQVNNPCNPITRYTTNATQSEPAINCNGNTGNADDDVWFVFNFSANTQYTITVDGSANFDAVVELLVNCGTNINCADGTLNGGVETISYTTGGSVGTRHIRVYHYGAGSGSGSFTICVTTGTSPTSNISSISPAPVPCSNSPQTITLNGSNFVSGSTVTLVDITNGGTYAKASSFISSSQLQVTANFTAVQATWSAQVTAPSASNTVQFQVCQTANLPTINSITPNPVPGSNSPQTITLNGGNFTSGSTVTLKDLTNGGTYAKSATFINSTQLQVSANFTNTTATWSAQITAPATSNTVQFQVNKICALTSSTPTLNSPGSSSPSATIPTETPTLSWNSVSGASAYEVNISIAPYATSNIIYTASCLTGTSHSVPPNKLFNGNQYRWDVEASDFCGSNCISQISANLYFLVSTVGITENENNPHFKIYPNPTRGNFIIEFSGKPQDAEISVMNVLGEMVYSETVKNIYRKEISLKNANAGVYFVRVKIGEEISFNKLILNK